MPGNQEQLVELTFPRAGVDVSRAFATQQPAQLADGSYARTTAYALNVRTYEPLTNRARGGQRPGLFRYINARPNGNRLIQELVTLVGVGYTPPGGSVQTSQSGRVVTLVSVSGGNVYAASPGGTSWVAALNGTIRATPLSTSGVVQSTALGQKLYLVDGINHVVYDPATNTVTDWVATAGVLPTGSDGGTFRLVQTWRGRIVGGGLIKDGQNWGMSRVNNALDWNNFPDNPSSDQPVAGNDSPLGLVGDTVTCFIAYTDDVLIVGSDHEIYQFQGDPAAGGQIAPISRAIGMAWGAPWCVGPSGEIYFFANRPGIYVLTPGQGPPQRISNSIDSLVLPIDTGANTIRLIWNDRFQGLQLFVTPTAAAGEAMHFFWEQRANAWWTDRFTDPNMNPLCCTTFDGNEPGDRVALIGSWDGYVRSIDPTATDDDGEPILSSVVIGPLNTVNLDQMRAKDLQGVLGETSGIVTYSIYAAHTAEQALLDMDHDADLPADAVETRRRRVAHGIWRPSSNRTSPIRRAGKALYVKIDASNPWALEQIRIRLQTVGKIMRRGR